MNDFAWLKAEDDLIVPEQVPGSKRKIEATKKDREVRRRKKEKTNDLESRVNSLEHENLQLRLQLRVGRETVQRDKKEKLDITDKLQELVDKNAGDKEIAQTLKVYVKKFSDYGTERTSSIEKHMDQLERLLMPTQVTKMCMWSLHQDDDFYKQGIDDSNNIWHIVCKEIEASDDQMDKIKKHRDDARRLAKDLRFTLRECEDLKTRLERKNQTLAEEMKQLQTVLSPTQLAKFILWVNRNPASMAMLDKLWNPADDVSKASFSKPENLGSFHFA